MKSELTLLDLNELYYMSTKSVDERKETLKGTSATSSTYEYFQNEVLKAERLRDMLQTALYDEAKRIDESIATYLKNVERDYSSFENYATNV